MFVRNQHRPPTGASQGPHHDYYHQIHRPRRGDVLAVTVLSGCAPTGGFDSGTVDKTVKPSVTAGPLTAATIEIRQHLTSYEATTLGEHREALSAAGKVLYKPENGDTVVVGIAKPLPPDVSFDAEVKLAAAESPS